MADITRYNPAESTLATAKAMHELRGVHQYATHKVVQTLATAEGLIHQARQENRFTPARQAAAYYYTKAYLAEVTALLDEVGARLLP